MTALTEFLPYVLPYANGVAQPVALFQIRESCEQLCRRSHIIQKRVTLQKILIGDTVVGDFDTDYYAGITVNGNLRYPVARVGTDQYVAPADTGMRPHEPQSMWMKLGTVGDNRELNIRPVDADAVDRTPYSTDKENAPAYFIRYPDEIVEVLPVPEDLTDVLQLDVRISFIPLPSATEVSTALFNNWRQYVADGALQVLYETPDQPYSDLKAAFIKRNSFNAGVGKARIQVNTGRTRVSITPVPQPWA